MNVILLGISQNGNKKELVKGFSFERNSKSSLSNKRCTGKY